jgi:putative nucleotidyltransferase with HDIG domain
MSYFGNKLNAIFRAFSSRNINDKDVEFIREYLNKQEQVLFYRMSLIDQKHSLAVAYSVKEMVGRRSRINLEKTLKTALLHDVGKIMVKLSVMDRINQTIMFKFFKLFADYLAERGKNAPANSLRKKLYAYKYHSQFGADLVREIKTEENIAYLIEHHHDETTINEPIELTILREADNLN